MIINNEICICSLIYLDSVIRIHQAKLFHNGVTTEAIQIFGGYGYLRTYLVEKLFRDAKVYQIYEDIAEVQRIVISCYSLGEY